MGGGASADSATPGSSTTPLIGRSRELAELTSLLHSGTSMVLTGPAGVGKTRLASALAAHAKTSGWQTYPRHATATTQQIPLALLADIVPFVGIPPPPAAIGAVLQALSERFADHSVLIVVDDAHLCDDASSAILQRLIDTRSVTIALTCREHGSLPVDLRGLGRLGQLSHLEVEPLGVEDTWQLGAALGLTTRFHSKESLHAQTGGLPMFVLASARRERRGGGPAIGLTRPDVDLIAEVLGSPARAELDALELVALGQPLELSVLEAVCDADALDRVESAGLIVVERERRRRFARMGHPLYAEAAIQQLHELRRRRHLRRLVEEIQQFGASRHDDLLRTVVWRLSAGDPVPDEQLVTAAQRSLALGGVVLAEEIVRDHLDPASSAEVAFLAASIHLERARPTDAVAACAAAPTSNDEDLQVRLGITWAIACYAHLGDVEAARRALDIIRFRVGASARRQLDYFEIPMSFYTGDVERALTLVDSFLAEPDVPELTRVWFMLPGVLALATSGRVSEALQHAEVATQLAPNYARTIVAVEAHAWCTRAYAAVHSGILTGLREQLTARLPAAGRSGDALAIGLLQMVSGLVALHEARFEDAVDLLEAPNELGGGWEFAARAWRVQALALGGRKGEARRAASLLATPPHFALYEPLNAMARADAALADHDLVSAVKHFGEATDHATAHGQWTFALLATFRHFAADPSDELAPVLSAAASRHDGSLGKHLRDVSYAWLHRDVSGLQTASAAFDDLGNRLYAGLLDNVRATMLEQTLPGTAAATAARRAAQARWRRTVGTASASERSGGSRAKPPERLDPDELTEREQEVRTQAAAGLTDNEIADELGVSPRTVHAHLRSIYRKLDIRGRRDL